MRSLLRAGGLHTVCESALCPNLGECFERHCATFMIMGDVCTRDCHFCAVAGGTPSPLDDNEPRQVAKVAARLGLSHVVVTSVTRDDLPDGGAAHFAATIAAVKDALPGCSVEVLIPDFQGDERALWTVLEAKPEVLNHNVETVPRLYPDVRPQAAYQRSLDLLARSAAEGSCVVKSGLMLGLGETAAEVRMVLADLASEGVDVVTLGQYLQPSTAHLSVAEFIPPEAFAAHAAWGEETLELVVEAGPFVRSSFHAEESFEKAKEKRRTRRARHSGPGGQECRGARP